MKTHKILVVEDDNVSQKVLELLLKHLGHPVDIATTGQQALEFFKQQTYSIVFMDVGLPDNDGIALTQNFRAHEAEHALPRAVIIALTASSNLENACLASGMDDFLVKPILLETLEAKLRLWLR